MTLSGTPRASTQMVCKTFIHRFDSDRRLHNLNKFKGLLSTGEIQHFRLSSWVTPKGFLRKLVYTDSLEIAETLMNSHLTGIPKRENICSRGKNLHSQIRYATYANGFRRSYSKRPRSNKTSCEAFKYSRVCCLGRYVSLN